MAKETTIRVYKDDSDKINALLPRVTAEWFARGINKSAKQPDAVHWLLEYLEKLDSLKTNTPLSHALSATVAGQSDQTV